MTRRVIVLNSANRHTGIATSRLRGVYVWSSESWQAIILHLTDQTKNLQRNQPATLQIFHWSRETRGVFRARSLADRDTDTEVKACESM